MRTYLVTGGAGFIGSNYIHYMFEKYGQPTWYVDRLIYTYPLYMAAKFNTPLLVYGVIYMISVL